MTDFRGVLTKTTTGAGTFWHSAGIEDRLPGYAGIPAKPTGLSATPGSNSAVLSWDAVTGADSIAVYYREGTEGEFTLATAAVAGDATSYNLTSIDPETLYNWYITATNAAGTSEASDIEDFTTTEASAWTPGEAPVPISYSGTFAQGNTITITGTNLSANRQTQLFYDDFTSGALGQPLGNGWQQVGGDGAYVYDDDGMRTGASCAYIHMADGWDFDCGRTFAESGTIYFEHWIRYSTPVIGPNDGSGSSQIKLTRVGAGTSLSDNSDNPNFGPTKLSMVGDSVAAFQSVANPSLPTTYIDLPSDDSWHKLHMATKLSSEIGVADGWRYIKTSVSDWARWSNWDGTDNHYASPTGVVPKSEWRGENMVTRHGTDSSTVAGFYQKILLPFFQRTYQESHIRIANFWINDSAERVVIGTASTWDACAKTAIIQPNISRTNTSWQFTCETGNLPTTGPLYAYVVNADGTYNTTGLLVRAA